MTPRRPSHTPGPCGRLRIATRAQSPAKWRQNAPLSCAISIGEPGKSPSFLRTGSIVAVLMSVECGISIRTRPTVLSGRARTQSYAPPHACELHKHSTLANETASRRRDIEIRHLSVRAYGATQPRLLATGRGARRRSRSSRRTTRSPRCPSDTWCASRRSSVSPASVPQRWHSMAPSQQGWSSRSSCISGQQARPHAATRTTSLVGCGGSGGCQHGWRNQPCPHCGRWSGGRRCGTAGLIAAAYLAAQHSPMLLVDFAFMLPPRKQPKHCL